MHSAENKLSDFRRHKSVCLRTVTVLQRTPASNPTYQPRCRPTSPDWSRSRSDIADALRTRPYIACSGDSVPVPGTDRRRCHYTILLSYTHHTRTRRNLCLDNTTTRSTGGGILDRCLDMETLKIQIWSSTHVALICWQSSSSSYTPSSLRITDRSYRFAPPCLWN